MRDGNLFLISLDGPRRPSVRAADRRRSRPRPQATADAAAGAARRRRRLAADGAAAAQRGGGAGAGAAGAASDTEAQRFLREQERELFEFIRKQIEERERNAAAGRGGRGGRGGGGGRRARRRRRSRGSTLDAAPDAGRSAALDRRALRVGRRHRAARGRRARPGHAELRDRVGLSRDDSGPHERRRRAVAAARSRFSI